MARLQHSLSSLRRWGCLHATPDALPAAGQALPGRIGYLQGPYERFQRWSLHVILLPQAFLAQAGSGRRLPGRPSRRSVRAQLRHTARHGTSSLRTAHRVDDQRARQRVTLAQRVEGVPGEAARPRAARQPLLPGALHGVPEAAQRFAVARNSVVRTMPTQLLTQRLMLLRNR